MNISDNRQQIPVFLTEHGNRTEAEALAAHLRTPLIEALPESGASPLCLRMDETGLSLVGDGMTLQADLSSMLPRLKTANLREELLIRAAKQKDVKRELSAVDATAGFGEDALLLAAAGFSVTLYEYDPIIAALLRDSLRRARETAGLQGIVARMELIEGNSIDAMGSLAYTPDVILLDPMFPERQKSASVKKKFQLLHYLESPCTAEEALLNAAIAAHPHKILIKRPVKGAFLAGRKPSYSIGGKAIRYDCIVLT